MSFSMLKRRAAALLLALAVATGVAVAVAPVAAHAAEQKCNEAGQNKRTFKIPDQLDPTVEITLCVRKNTSGNWVSASAFVEWTRGPVGIIGGFDKFEFNLRIEKDDAVKARYGCYPRDAINNLHNGEYLCPSREFGVAADSANTWTADATVRYNIDGDGKGDYLWDLTGTGRV